MKTTLREIRAHNPCSDGWHKLCKGLGTTDFDTEVSILQILEINDIEDAFWALCTQNYLDYCLVLADIAEIVLHIFEKKYPDDMRPGGAIMAIRNYKEGKISLKELKYAASAAYAAAKVAASGKYASASVSSAAYNAAYAAYAAANDVAYDVASASAYAYAAYNVTYAIREKQWIINEEILRKYLEGCYKS